MEGSIDQLKITEKDLKTTIEKINFYELDLISYNQMAPLLHDICMHLLRPLDLDHIQQLNSKQPPSLKEKIKHAQQRLTAVTDQLADQQALHKELLQREEELVRMEAQHRNFTKRIKQLQELERLVGDLDFKTPEEKIGQLEKVLEEGLPALREKLERMCELLEGEEKKVFQQTQSNAQKLVVISKKILEDTRLLKGDLQEGLDKIKVGLPKFEKSYNDLVDQYNTYYDKLQQCAAQIKKIDEVHAKNVKVYEKHFAENKMIWGSLNEPPKALEYVEQMVQEMDEKLKTFDRELKKLIAKKQSTWPESYTNGTKK